MAIPLPLHSEAVVTEASVETKEAEVILGEATEEGTVEGTTEEVAEGGDIVAKERTDTVMIKGELGSETEWNLGHGKPFARYSYDYLSTSTNLFV